MAVQKSKKSKSRKNMRRSHDAISCQQLSIDHKSGEKKIRHNMSKDGFYRGKKVLENS